MRERVLRCGFGLLIQLCGALVVATCIAVAALVAQAKAASAVVELPTAPSHKVVCALRGAARVADVVDVLGDANGEIPAAQAEMGLALWYAFREGDNIREYDFYAEGDGTIVAVATLLNGQLDALPACWRAQ